MNSIEANGARIPAFKMFGAGTLRTAGNKNI